MKRAAPILLTALLSGPSVARADMTLLLEEQIGGVWNMNPDHTSIYFSRVCAESPVRLRRCAPGEQGAVISRYHRIDGYDWVAIPLIPYLYAVERPDEVPPNVTSEEAFKLQQAYRKKHLEGVAPDDELAKSKDWPQLVGEAYVRTIYGFRIQTTAEQDDELIRALNSRPNRNRFNIVFRNCADFAEQVIDLYFPDAAGRSFTDLGIMTPRHVAESLVRYGQRHPDLKFSIFEIAQVPGTAPRSKPMGHVLSMKYAMMSFGKGSDCGSGLAASPPTLTCLPQRAAP